MDYVLPCGEVTLSLKSLQLNFVSVSSLHETDLKVFPQPMSEMSLPGLSSRLF